MSKGKAIRGMDEFKRVYFPLDYAKEQRENRIAEVGFGRAMAEEALKKVFGARLAERKGK